MKSRFAKGLATCLTLAIVTLALATPANAGTLTSATFTTNGAGYTTTNAVNTRYDWRFTTASNSTAASGVALSLPAGTTAAGNKFLALSNSTGDYASTPDSVANSIAGDIDIRAKVALRSWTPNNDQIILSKWGSAGGSLSYLFLVTPDGKLQFVWNDSSGYHIQISTASVGLSNGSSSWLRATNRASGGNELTDFFTSIDGTNWTALGTQIVYSGTGSITDTTTPVMVGSSREGTSSGMNLNVFYVDVRNAVPALAVSASSCASPNVALCFNPNDYTAGTSFSSSSSQHEAWTINRSASTYPADIAISLNVAESANLPTGGFASLRLIDSKAVYKFLAITNSISNGVPCFIALSGFTNTAIAGSYSSTITTFDNSGSGNTIDSATTAALTFTDLASTATVGTTVDPTFSFTVSSHSGACNSFAQTAGVTTGAIGVALGRVNSSSGSIGAQDLSVGTNANTGFSLQLRTSGPLTAGSNSISNATGTNATPAAFPVASTGAFGYTVSGLPRFSSAWAGPETTNREVMNGATVGTVTNCIAYRVQVTASTPAGTYATTSYYTAIPTF